jgi:hypothetical protein
MKLSAFRISGLALNPESRETCRLAAPLPGMLALAHGGNAGPSGAAVPDAYRRSVKVVSGARNHLNLLFEAPKLG